MANYFLKCVDFFVTFEFNIFLEKNASVFLNKVCIHGNTFDVLDIRRARKLCCILFFLNIKIIIII